MGAVVLRPSWPGELVLLGLENLLAPPARKWGGGLPAVSLGGMAGERLFVERVCVERLFGMLQPCERSQRCTRTERRKCYDAHNVRHNGT